VLLRTNLIDWIKNGPEADQLAQNLKIGVNRNIILCTFSAKPENKIVHFC
jgi:hypothetical protein